jgi:putative DNA-invertase from lambdoid prophage Rac
MIFYYLRVSTVEQASNGNSFDAQRDRLAGYGLMQGRKDLRTETFIDSGVSGSIALADRPAGTRLLAAVKRGDAIVSTKLDRMFRSAADALTMLEDLKAKGVSLHLLDMNGDVLGNGVSRLLFGVLALTAEFERDRLRERIREVKRHLAEQGVYGGGRRPFGFDVVEGKLVPNKGEQKAIARMRHLRKRGKTLREIAQAVGIKNAITVKRILDRAGQARGARS